MRCVSIESRALFALTPLTKLEDLQVHAGTVVPAFGVWGFDLDPCLASLDGEGVEYALSYGADIVEATTKDGAHTLHLPSTLYNIQSVDIQLNCDYHGTLSSNSTSLPQLSSMHLVAPNMCMILMQAQPRKAVEG
jgi:hypothetical protein